MKKRIIALFAVLVLACGVLVGCGKSEEDGHNAAFVGEWELTAIEGDGAVAPEDLELMKDLGLTATLSISESGTATLNLFGEDLGQGEWSSSSSSAGTLIIDGQKINLSLEGGELRLSQQGDVLVFTKAS